MATSQYGQWHFPQFTNLPPELREMIWRACLPYRIRELDEADITTRWAHKNRFKICTTLCTLRRTTTQNVKPPTISRVCRESRKVALESGGLFDWDHDARIDYIEHPPHSEWIDRQRISPYITYQIVEEEWDHCLDMPFIENALGKLAVAVTSSTAPGCFTQQLLSSWHSGPSIYSCIGRPNANDAPITGSPQLVPLTLEDNMPVTGPISFEPKYYTLKENKEKYIALKQHAEWLVVMETLILHCASEAIATGLFGVYGDAPIQIIRTAEEHKITKLYDLLAETDEHEDVLIVQDYKRRTGEEWKRMLRGLIWGQQYPDDLADRLQPAILFRLCHERCNQTDEEARDFVPSD